MRNMLAFILPIVAVTVYLSMAIGPRYKEVCDEQIFSHYRGDVLVAGKAIVPIKVAVYKCVKSHTVCTIGPWYMGKNVCN